MREIKFRVWSPIAKKWIYGPENEVALFGDCILCGEFCQGLSMTDVYSLISLQYTGLKDKNGKEIYGGDIIESKSSEGHSIMHLIEWHDAGFYATLIIDGETTDTTFVLQPSWIKEHGKAVVGNKYDNPELLNKQP